MAQTLIYSLMVAPHLSWVIGALNEDETTSNLQLASAGVIRYTDGGGADVLPAHTPALNGSAKTFDRTAAVWLGYTIRASGVLSLCREADLAAVDGDVAVLCRIDRHTIHPFRVGAPSGGSGGGGGDGTTPAPSNLASALAVPDDDITLTTDGVFYDACHVTLAEGYWHTLGVVCVDSETGGETLAARLADVTDGGTGGTVYSEVDKTEPTGADTGQALVGELIPIYADGSLVYLSVASDVGGETLRKDHTRLQAVRVGDPPRREMAWVTRGGAAAHYLTDGTPVDFPMTFDPASNTTGAWGICLVGADQVWIACEGFPGDIDHPDVIPPAIMRFYRSGHTAGPDIADSHLVAPRGICVVGDKVWVVNQSSGEGILRYNLDGTFFDYLAADTDGYSGIAVVDDEVWITNHLASVITRFNLDGTSAGINISSGNINSPQNLAVVADDDVWVCNSAVSGTGFNRVAALHFDGSDIDLYLVGDDGFVQPFALLLVHDLVWVTQRTGEEPKLYRLNLDGSAFDTITDVGLTGGENSWCLVPGV